MWIFVRCDGIADTVEVHPDLQMSDRSVLVPVTILTTSRDERFRKRVNNILKDYQGQRTHLVVFFNHEWQDYLTKTTERMGLQWLKWSNQEADWPIKNACIFADISLEQVKEVFKVTTWYVSIEEAVKINASASIEEALGILKRPIIIHGQVIDFHHLIVVKDNTDDVIGVVTEEQLDNILSKDPINIRSSQRSPRHVETYMFPLLKIPRLDSTMSKNEVRQALSQPAHWALFREPRIVFLIDKEGEVVGFATDFDLFRE